MSYQPRGRNWRYPDPRVEVLDKRFKARIGNAAIERIATGCRRCGDPGHCDATPSPSGANVDAALAPDELVQRLRVRLVRRRVPHDAPCSRRL
jgi:hypothetical protein